jgi:ParB family chromosome partitioning protein
MGAKERKAAHGNVKTRDLPQVDPEDLVLVTDEKSPLYDARVLDEPSEEMILNIMFYGPIEPVVTVKNTETGKYEVADGRTRVKACREANKRLKKRGGEPWLMPFLVKRTDAGGAVGLMVTLNEQRRDDTPLNRAHKAAKMLEHGKTEEEVALAFGLSVSSVKNLIKLVDAPAAVRNAVQTGKITASEGYKLSKLEPGEARKKVGQLISEAPRAPGKKRSTNAKKAREIVDGPKAAPTARMRSENSVENVLRELQEQDRNGAGGSALTRGAIVALQWVLGDDEALQALGLAKTGSTVAHLYGKGEVPRAAAT